MGCQLSNQQIPRIDEKTRKMLSKLHKLKAIGFTRTFSIENKNSLIKLSKLLNRFIENEDTNYLKDTIHIIFKLMDLIEKILKTRSQHDFRFIMINFDKIYYDKIKNKMVYNDLNIMSNYTFKYILIGNNEVEEFSLNTFIYNKSAGSYYYYHRIQDTYTLEKGINFYSLVFIEILKKIFKKSNNDLKYEKFRKTINYNIKDFYKNQKDLTFENVKNIFVDALKCNQSMDEVLNSYVTDTCSSILTDL
jgi:hypothetical protein